MRHRYDTPALVLSRAPLGEASAFVTLLTPTLGLVRARAQGVRRPGAKLASALTTFSESSVILVRGKEGWRITGAVGEEQWSRCLSPEARQTAARVVGLLLRLSPNDIQDQSLFTILVTLFKALTMHPIGAFESIEILTALRILAVLGLDAGDIPGTDTNMTKETLLGVRGARGTYIARINRGITASGL